MNLLYIGAVTDESQLNLLSGVSIAGNNMQLNILRELNQYEDVNIHIVAVAPYAAFPREKKMYIKRKYVKIDDNLIITQISYINLPIIKQAMQMMNTYFAAKKYLQDDSILMSFNLYPQEGCPLLKLSKKYGNKAVAILADLPINDNYSMRRFKKKIYDIFFNITKKNIQECRNLIVLNRNAISEFATHDVNYIVMEGGISSKSIQECVSEASQPLKKNIVYSGALSDYSGIMDLIQAMEMVNNNIVLEIYGGGNLADSVKVAAQKYINVIYKGQVSHDKMIEIQKNAWLLVNPRPVDDSIARVTFPSKMFEYLISGRPVLSTKQKGFTEEYLKIMLLIDDNSPCEIARKINDIASMKDEELNEIGNSARKYIIDNKTWSKQVSKIYEFITNKLI